MCGSAIQSSSRVEWEKHFSRRTSPPLNKMVVNIILHQQCMLSVFIVTCERWDGCSGLGVNVVLESVRLSWNNHRDRLHQVLRIEK